MTWFRCGGGSQQTSQTTFRYLKLHITANHGASILQLSEIGFRQSDNTTEFSFPSGRTITSSKQPYSPGEVADNLLDGNTGTKMTCAWSSGDIVDVVIDLGSGEAIDVSIYPIFYYKTANDVPERDPKSWILYGANQSDFSDAVILDRIEFCPKGNDRQSLGYCGRIASVNY